MLADALQKVAAGLHGVADAADRLKAQPKLAMTIDVTPGSVARALVEEIRAGRAQEALDLIKGRVQK